MVVVVVNFIPTVAVPRHEVLAVVIYLAIYFATMLGNKVYEWYGHTKSSTNCKQYDSLKSKLFWVAHDVFSYTFVFLFKIFVFAPINEKCLLLVRCP